MNEPTSSEASKYNALVLSEINRLTRWKHEIENKAPGQRTEEELWFLIHVEGTIKEYERELR